jgi:hypothetical protein
MTLRHASIYYYCDYTSLAFYNGGPAGNMTTYFKTMVLSRSLSGQTKAPLASLVRIRVKVKMYYFKIKHNTIKAYGGVVVQFDEL